MAEQNWTTSPFLYGVTKVKCGLSAHLILCYPLHKVHKIWKIANWYRLTNVSLVILSQKLSSSSLDDTLTRKNIELAREWTKDLNRCLWAGFYCRFKTSSSCLDILLIWKQSATKMISQQKFEIFYRHCSKHLKVLKGAIREVQLLIISNFYWDAQMRWNLLRRF